MSDLRQALIKPNRSCVVAVVNPVESRAAIIEIIKRKKVMKIITVIDKGYPALKEINQVYEVAT